MSSGRKLLSSMTSTIATATGHYSSLDEKIAKMRKMKHKANDNDDDGDDDDDAMDVDEEDSSAERHLQQGVLKRT